MISSLRRLVTEYTESWNEGLLANAGVLTREELMCDKGVPLVVL